MRAALRLLGVHNELVVRHLIRFGEVSFELPDGQRLRLWSRGDDGISNAVFWKGWTGSEATTAPVFYRLARRARTVLDIGAYVGYYTVIAAAANPSSSVHAFEPLAPIRERLQKHVELNHLGNVRVVGKAVGAAPGSAEFYHTDPGGLPTSSSLSSAFMNEAVPVGLQSSTVEVVAIDDYVREQQLSKVDLVKIDTETTEGEVLRGMRKTLERDRPDLICEVLPFRDTAHTIEEKLKPFGYRFYHLTERGPVLHEHLQPSLQAMNYLFSVRDNHAAS